MNEMNLNNGQMNLQPILVHKARLTDYLKTIENGTEFQMRSLPKFNRIINGFERKKLIVLGSRTSECKSSFAIQLGYELSQKFKVLYLSLEMTLEEVMFRLACNTLKIANTDFYDRKVSFDVVNTFYKNLDNEKRRFIYRDNIGKDWNEIELIMQSLKENKPDIIFLDYIGCIRSAGKKRETIEDYIKNFRKLAIDYNMCIFILAQINRTNISESKEPSMEGLKDTGFLEEHADKVIILYYPCKRDKSASINDFKIIISKNKNGMTGYLNCRVDPQYYFFSDIEEKKTENTKKRIDWGQE